MRIFFFSMLLLSLWSCRSQKTQSPDNQKNEWTVGFYNVENLFDTLDHPDKIDEEFLPGSDLGWNSSLYQQKLANLSRAISSMGNGGPDVLGVAEVENATVLQDLAAALPGRRYGVVHEESPDMRGIDVGLLYDKNRFTYVGHVAAEVDFPAEPDYTSRKILLVEGKLKKETVYVLVNHWPSRYGGAEKSEPRRMQAATVARALIDSIRQLTPDAHLMVMGDFNDDPFNRSLTKGLNSQKIAESMPSDGLYSPFWRMHQVDSVGTLTYRGKWNLFDQILLSPSLLDEQGLEYQIGSAYIHRPEFMQVGGDGRAKDMPRRAIYRGEFQERGFSDHFPVMVTVGK
ncbi:MAG: endonuclease/exonuclease/phosphatase family protein [Bacteroidota bacterium]